MDHVLAERVLLEAGDGAVREGRLEVCALVQKLVVQDDAGEADDVHGMPEGRRIRGEREGGVRALGHLQQPEIPTESPDGFPPHPG